VRRPHLTIKRIELDDIPECFAIARASYSVPFDERAMYDWALKALNNPNVIGVMTEDAFGLAAVSAVAWEPAVLHGAQQFLAVRDKRVFQACKIVKIMRDWCLDVRGAVDYHFGEATGMDMSIIAKRVGAVQNSPTYVCMRNS
jgi:hypothetical protein